MRFYADENFPLAVVVRLRELGHDVLTVFEDGLANKAIEDEPILLRATSLGRTILTINRIDFKKLHYKQQDHAGVVICTFDSDFSGQAERIHEACSESGDLKGVLVKIYRPSKN